MAPLLPTASTINFTPMTASVSPPDYSLPHAGRLGQWATGAVVALLVAMHGVIVWLVRAPTIGTGNDDATYLLLARALRDGHYRELFYVSAPIHSQYPPGYPALLALLGAPADGSIGTPILANIVLSCAMLVLLYDVVRRWSPILGVVMLAVMALNPALIAAASRVQSEPLFTAAVMLALWAVRPSAPRRLRWVAIASVLVAALTRSAGTAVVAGVLAHFLLSRDWSSAAVLTGVALLTLVPWLAWTIVAPEKVAGRSYIADAVLDVVPDPSTPGAAPAVQPARPFPLTLAHRVRYATRVYLSRKLPSQLGVPTVPGTIVDNAAWLLLMLTVAAVGCFAMWSRWRAALLAFVAYTGLLLLWPYAIARFLTPLLPVFLVITLLGAWRAGVRVLPRAALLPALVVAAILIFGGSRLNATMVRAGGVCAVTAQVDEDSCGTDADRYAAIARAFSARMPEGSTVFTAKEGTFYYHTGRRVVSVYRALDYDTDSLREYLRATTPAAIFLPHLKDEEELLGAPLAGMCAELTEAGAPSDTVLMLWVRPPNPGEQDGCDAITRWRATWGS